MQIRVQEFNQEEFEKSFARVIKVLSLEQKTSVRNTFLGVVDAINQANETKRVLDEISLEQPTAKPVARQPTAKQPVAKPVARQQDYDEPDEEVEQVFEVE